MRPKRSNRSRGVPAADRSRRGAALFAAGCATAAIYYGLGVTEHSQGSTTGHGHRQPCHGDRQHRPCAAWA